MSKVDAARKMLSWRNTGVIEAEKALATANRLREDAESALVQAEAEDNCCGVCP